MKPYPEKENDFYAEMDAKPNAVYAVELYGDGRLIQLGLFSTKERAELWSAKPEYDSFTAVVVPYVIDEPDFGNVRAN